MACVSKMKNPRTKKVTGYCIQFYSHDGSKKKLYGFNRESSAIVFGEHLDRLVSYRKRGEEVDRKLQQWIDELPDTIHERLVRWGLVIPKEKERTLKDLIDVYLIGDRSNGRKKESLNVRKRWYRRLLEFFGPDREVRTITSEEIVLFDEKYRTIFAPSSWYRAIAYYRGTFNYAVKHGWIQLNPFEAIRSCEVVNTSRQCFVDNETATTVLAHCRTSQERLIFCLSRYGGLRIPSEIQYMTWDDIDFEAGKFLVKSPKKESLVNQERGVFTDRSKRYVPIFPELRKAFTDYRQDFPINGGQLLFVRSEKNPHGLLTRAHDAVDRVIRIAIRKAGVKAWPKIFHNMRSTRETELIASGMAVRDVCAILGHSPEMALKHYVQVSSSLFMTATGMITNSEIIK